MYVFIPYLLEIRDLTFPESTCYRITHDAGVNSAIVVWVTWHPDISGRRSAMTESIRSPKGYTNINKCTTHFPHMIFLLVVSQRQPVFIVFICVLLACWQLPLYSISPHCHLENIATYDNFDSYAFFHTMNSKYNNIFT